MTYFDIILIAVGLAMDCFAVSITHGLSYDRSRKPLAYYGPWLMAVMFGLFQGSMPLVGYFAGTLFADFFSKFAPWIALILLAGIGCKMIWESLHPKDEEKTCADFSLKHISALAIATSIDALATGVIFIPVPEMLWIGVGIIALVSFLFSVAGYSIGAFVGQKFHFNVELLGGVILIIIGLKIFVEGIFF